MTAAVLALAVSHTKVSRLWMSLPAAQLREDLLHFPQNVSKHGRLLKPRPIWPKAEAKPPSTIKGVLLVPSEAIIVESIFLIVVVFIIMSHCIKERVPKEKKKGSH